MKRTLKRELKVREIVRRETFAISIHGRGNQPPRPSTSRCRDRPPSGRHGAGGRRPRGCTFAVDGSTWILPAWEKGRRKVAPLFASVGRVVLQTQADTRWWIEDTKVPASASYYSALAGPTALDRKPVLGGEFGQLQGRHSSRELRMLTKWSQPTRLVTRTKESNVRASRRVVKLSRRNESEGAPGAPMWEAVDSDAAAPWTDLEIRRKV